MKFDRFDPTYESYQRWSALCPESKYQTLKPDALSGLLPDDLLGKVHHAIIIASGTEQGTVYVANLRRVDKPDSALDQTPYIAAFDHQQLQASGGFVHHGSWSGRTERPGEGFFRIVEASGITAYFPLEADPTLASGSIDQLDSSSDKEAFWISLSALGRSG